MEFSEDILDEQVEALNSIYEEGKISKNGIEVVVPLAVEQDRPVVFTWMIGDKVIESIRAKAIKGLEFRSELPVTAERLTVDSDWLDPELIAKFKSDIIPLVESSTWEDVTYLVFDYLFNELPYKYNNEICKEYITHDRDQFEKYKRMVTTAREAEFQKARFICSLCLEGNDGINGLQLPCDHTFCNCCFLEYCPKMIEIDDVTRLQCPNCPYDKLPSDLTTMPYEQVKEILFNRKISKHILESTLPTELFTKYESFRTGLLFAKYQELFPHSCTVCPRCAKWLFRDDVDEQLVHCIHCSFAYCFDCHRSWHGKNNFCGSKKHTIPLEVIEAVIETPLDQELLMKHQAKYGRKNLELAVKDYEADRSFRAAVENDDSLVECPGCKTIVIKSDGCNKMRCEKCYTDFCYLCGNKLHSNRPYEHYSDLRSDCYGKLFEGMLVDGEEFRAPGFIPFA